MLFQALLSGSIKAITGGSIRAIIDTIRLADSKIESRRFSFPFLGRFTDLTEGFKKGRLWVDFIINPIPGLSLFDDAKIH